MIPAGPTKAALPAADTGRAGRMAVILPFVRGGMVAAATVAAWLIMCTVGDAGTFPPTPTPASLSLIPVNIISLLLVSRLMRSEGSSLRSLFSSGRSVLRDAGWGLLWFAVLYVPGVLAVSGTMWVLNGPAC